MQIKSKLQIVSPKFVNSLFIGNFKAAFSGRGIEFQDFRKYTHEDDAKYIDWVTSNREGKIIMRRYREEKQGTVLAIFDVRESLEFTGSKVKKQLAMQIIELLAYASFGSGERFGGYILGKDKIVYIPPKKSKTTLFQMLTIDNIIPKVSSGILDLQDIIKNPIKKSVVFVISDNLQIDEKTFGIAALKHDIIYVHISSYFENMLSGKGMNIFKGNENILGLDLDNIKKKEKYKHKRQEKLKSFEKKLRKLGIGSIFIDEKKSIYVEFLQFMKRREQ